MWPKIMTESNFLDNSWKPRVLWIVANNLIRLKVRYFVIIVIDLKCKICQVLPKNKYMYNY
jgi:hypothetical protein